MQHEIQLDSHDVDSDAGCCPSDWTFKPAFGIVHAKGCSICSSYMTHLIIANDSNNASFQVALRDRECLVSKAFMDGTQNGRELQEDYDAPVLARYRRELDKAVQSAEQHQKMLDAAKKEIGVLQEQMLALQMQLDHSVSNTHNCLETNADSTPSMERLLLCSPEDVDSVDVLSPLSSTADKLVLPIVSNLSTGSGDTTSIPSSPVSPDSRVNSLTEHSQPSKEPPPLTPQVKLSPTPSTEAQRREPPTPNKANPATPMLKPSNSSTSFSTQAVQDPSDITTITQLQGLMDAARDGNKFALKRVKTLSG